MSFANIMQILNTNNFCESELETISNLCNKKIKELNNEYYKNEIYNLIKTIEGYNIIETFINNINKLTFYEKFINDIHSYNIKFNYFHFIITLSHKISFCEFGGVSKENFINIIDIHQETCYNLWNDNMINKFINIINLAINNNELINLFNLMFRVYQPDENIKW